jgi:hypothetical protein
MGLAALTVPHMALKKNSGSLTGKIILTFIDTEELRSQTHPDIFYEPQLFLSITSVSGDF